MYPLLNSGLVLLNPYIPMLFGRCGIVHNNVFVNAQAQERAVLLLHCVATGQGRADEPDLVLNKVLCGLPINASIDSDDFQITEQEQEMIDGLLNAAIGYWPAIGSTSVDGFRGNWLVRDGVLLEEEDRWDLTVEKRAYDLLLDQSPFSFSMIKYAWMDKILHVNW